jgi:hypothetical protein
MPRTLHQATFDTKDSRSEREGGRAYQWCPFWGKMGIMSTRVTSITRASDYYTKSRVAVHFGSQVRGREGWVINNPKAKIVRRMLQLLQQRASLAESTRRRPDCGWDIPGLAPPSPASAFSQAGSGPLLASLKMPVWEPYPIMFRTEQPNASATKAQEPSALPTSKQN